MTDYEFIETFRAQQALTAAACNADRHAREQVEQRASGVLPLRSVCRVVEGFDGLPRLVFA